MGPAGRGRRLFEPPVPGRAGPARPAHWDCVDPTQGLRGHHTGACGATTQACGPHHRPGPPRTGFGEHWGRGSKTMVFGRFLTLKTVLFLGKNVKLPKKKKKTPETDNQRLRPPAPGPAPVDIGARGQNGHFRPTFFPEKHKILDDGHFLWVFQKCRRPIK